MRDFLVKTEFLFPKFFSENFDLVAKRLGKNFVLVTFTLSDTDKYSLNFPAAERRLTWLSVRKTYGTTVMDWPETTVFNDTSGTIH